MAQPLGNPSMEGLGVTCAKAQEPWHGHFPQVHGLGRRFAPVVISTVTESNWRFEKLFRTSVIECRQLD